MGGSTDAFSLYLSLFQVDRPTDASKPSTSMSFHRDAETKFEYGTANPRKVEPAPKQERLMTYEEVKADIDAENAKNKVDLPTEEIAANPTARHGRRLGGGDGGDEGGEGDGAEKKQEELSLGQRRQIAARAAEKRAAAQKATEGLKAGEVRELQIRAHPAA